MKQLTSEIQNIEKNTVSTIQNGHNQQQQHQTSENGASNNQKLTQYNNGSNNCSNINSSNAITTTTATNKSGLHLSFVASANESVSSANCKQCQIGKYIHIYLYTTHLLTFYIVARFIDLYVL